MRRFVILTLAVIAAGCAIWLWGFGGADQVFAKASAAQRDVQNAMARLLRALKQGQPGALTGLWGLCFAYGFFHAAGPGHGKLVIGGYGAAVRVPMGRLAALSVASSMAQAAAAVVVVYGLVMILGWSRARAQNLADEWMAPFSYALIAAVGLWLLLRGARKLWALRRVARAQAMSHKLHSCSDHHDHGASCDHGHGHGCDHAHEQQHHHADHCPDCGHAHGPTVEQAAQVKSLRDAVAIVASIAVRPCTGALFLLILTWRMDLVWAGIAGAFIMGLGAATITTLVAVASVSLREGFFGAAMTGRAARYVSAVIELVVGAGVFIIASQFVLRMI